MKCTVKQYCAYLCRMINHEPATITPHLEALATVPTIPKKGVLYGRKKARLAAQKSTTKH